MPAEDDRIRKEVGQLLSKAARDMSQSIVNLNKAISRGIEVPGFGPRDVIVIPKPGRSLTPIANSQTASDVTGEKNRRELLLIIKTMKAHANLFDQISSDLP